MQYSPAMRDMPASKDTTDKTALMASSMTKSMKYTMPIMIAFFGYAVPAAVTIYWIVSNLFMIVQEQYVLRKFNSKK
jgi:YidC/Oxa1 family membrane protein insertase